LLLFLSLPFSKNYYCKVTRLEPSKIKAIAVILNHSSSLWRKPQTKWWTQPGTTNAKPQLQCCVTSGATAHTQKTLKSHKATKPSISPQQNQQDTLGQVVW